jgi:hypothetical protein
MGMDAPHERRMEQSRQTKVVEIGAVPREQMRVLDALDAPARQTRGDTQMAVRESFRAWRP